jgi:hypothetical protein
MIVDVMSSVVLSSTVDEALLDGHRFLASRRRLLIDRYLSLVSGRLDGVLCGCPSTSRG